VYGKPATHKSLSLAPPPPRPFRRAQACQERCASLLQRLEADCAEAIAHDALDRPGVHVAASAGGGGGELPGRASVRNVASLPRLKISRAWNTLLMDVSPLNATCTGMFNEGAGEPQDFATWKKRGKDAHSVSADPLFSSPFPVRSGVPENVNLKPASPAILNFGFEPIDISSVGPREQGGRGGRGSFTPMAVPAELLEAGHIVSPKEHYGYAQ